MFRFARPGSELARSSSIPLIVLTASSSGLVSCVSTSSALAPGRETFTFTTAASVFGTAVDERGKAVKIGGFGIGLIAVILPLCAVAEVGPLEIVVLTRG